MFLASPGTTQPWPSRAAAWSPALPQMGTPARASRPFMPGATRPYSAELGTGAGSKMCIRDRSQAMQLHFVISADFGRRISAGVNRLILSPPLQF